MNTRLLIIILIAIAIFFVHQANANETCTQYGNRLECRNDDGGYREEYQYGNRTEKQGDYDE